MHLYFLSIINHLLSGHSLFSQYFAIRHPLPPYAFEYLLLFGLSKLAGLLLAEKIAICIFIILFCSGFRYLVSGINPGNRVISFFCLPLSLNWMLGMGFLNYALSLAFSLFALGFWIRATKSKKPIAFAVFLVVTVLILFTHPVPLLIIIAFIWANTILDVWQSYSKNRSPRKSFVSQLAEYRAQLTTVFLATCTLGYIALFVNSKQTSENLQHRWIQGGMIRDFYRLHPLVMTWGTLGSNAYRLFLYVVIAAAFLAGFRGLRKRFVLRHLDASDLMLVGAALLAFFYPLLPRSINGSDFFADRLVLYIWLFAIAGAAAVIRLGQSSRIVLAGTLTCVTILSLVVVDRQIRPAARVLMAVEQAGQSSYGEKGIFVDAPIAPSNEMLTFDPYFWSSARYFRRSNTIMLNPPWLELAILPVAPLPKLFTSLFPARLMNHPDLLAGELIKSQDVRDFVSSKIDFILFVGYSDRDPHVVDNVLKRSWPHPWNCNRTGWYSVCSD